MDKEKVLTKLAEMEGYVTELNDIRPVNFNEYTGEKKRACERLLQIAIEAALDVCNVLVAELKLGIPSSEEDVLERLKNKDVISDELFKKLRGMKAFRNILVHAYGTVEDKKVFSHLKNNIKDFPKFKSEIAEFLRTKKRL
jgi:uncharacterized protein YutE (UPF0331/DUF86 family)